MPLWKDYAAPNFTDSFGLPSKLQPVEIPPPSRKRSLGRKARVRLPRLPDPRWQYKRLLCPDEFYRIQQVHGPQGSPDGKWVAYSVTSVDRESDKRRTAVWMVNWEGTQDFRVTFGPGSDSSPRWRPDGKYLAFLSARPADGKSGDKEDKTQIWLLERRGGEASQLTNVKGDSNSVERSREGQNHVLAMEAR